MVEDSARDVLVVEDDPDTAELERRALNRAGIKAHLAASVHEAKALLRQHRFQAVLLDYQLPDGDAWDVVELARSLKPPVPVVLVTAMGSERVVAEAIQHGVVEYVRKSERFLDLLPDTVQRVARIAQYEENLRRSDALLQLIADHATDVILTLDAAGHLRYVSPASRRLLDWDSTKVIGHKLSDFIHLEDRVALIFQLSSEEPSSQLVFRCRKGDESLIWVEASFQRIRDAETGAIREILGILRNITERRESDERLRESEQRFRGAFETAAHGMALVSPEGRWLRVNRATCDMIGYSEAELLVIDFQTITHPDDLDSDLAQVQAMLAGEIETYQMEKRYFHKDGGIVWALLSVSLVRTASGEPLYFVSQIQNITDRKIAEDALRASEAEYRLLADNSNDMIVRIGTDGIRRYISPACRLLLGFDPEELVGESPLSVIHPEDRDQVVTACESLVTGTSNPICAYRQLHKDGHYVWLEASFRLVRDTASGEPLEIIASVRDVSRRTEAELRAAQAAARDRESHRLLVMAETIAHVGHWRLDAHTRALFWSDEVFRIHGRKIGDYPTLDEAIDVYHPDDRSMVHEAVELAITQGLPYEFPARIVRPDGEIRNVVSRAQIERAPDGRIIGVVGAFLDMTDQARTEAALREEEARYRLLAENATDIIFRLDAANRYIYVSPAIHDLTGLDPEALIGTNPIGRVHKEDQAAITEAFQALWTGQLNRIAVPYRAACADGSWHWLEMNAGTVRPPEGDNPIEIIGASRDIAERRSFETELVNARDAAEAATHAKSDFLATMSHEIRTPMAGILGMIELLRNVQDMAKAAPLLNGIEQSAQLLTTVLDDILDFSKIEGEHLVLEAVDFDLRALAEQTFAMFELSPASEKRLLGFQFQEGVTPYVVGDPTRLRQVIANLMSNAVKFTPEGQVDLQLALADPATFPPRWRVTVKDTGIGIDTEMISALFSPFVQADTSTTRKFGGTGLGLAICRRLIEAMGGEIGVDSKPGEGSLFWFEVPLPASSAVAIPEQPQDSAADFLPLNILLAEDNAINQTLIEGLLRQMGHHVTCVEHGRAAVDAVRSNAFDLVLMDMQMPEMDGPEAAAAIRSSGEATAGVPIIALTADASTQRRRHYEAAGIDGFLAKPIDSVKLAATLRDVRNRLLRSQSHHTLEACIEPIKILDEERLALIEKTLGSDQLDQLLAMFRDDISTRPGNVSDLIAAGDIPAARRSVHSLAGAALHLGAGKLADAARRHEFDITQASPLADQLSVIACETIAALDLYRNRQLRKDVAIT